MDNIHVSELSTDELQILMENCTKELKIRKQQNTITKLENMDNIFTDKITDIVSDFNCVDYIIEENIQFKMDGIECSMYYQGERGEFNPNIYIGDFIETEDDFDYFSFLDGSIEEINSDWISKKKKFKSKCKKYKVTDLEFITSMVNIFEHIRDNY